MAPTTSQKGKKRTRRTKDSRSSGSINSTTTTTAIKNNDDTKYTPSSSSSASTSWKLIPDLSQLSDNTFPMFATQQPHCPQPHAQPVFMFGDYGASDDPSLTARATAGPHSNSFWGDSQCRLNMPGPLWMDGGVIDASYYTPGVINDHESRHLFLSETSAIPQLSQPVHVPNKARHDLNEWHEPSVKPGIRMNDDEDDAEHDEDEEEEDHRTRHSSSSKRLKLEPDSSSRAAMSPFSDIGHDPGHEQVEKRERFLARNRVAASRCRLKKKAWQSDLQVKADQLSLQKDYLISIVTDLRNELIELKCRCLEHADCDCISIRRYLKRAVAAATPASDLYDSSDRKLSEASFGSSELDCVSPASLSRLDDFSPAMISPTDEATSDNGSQSLEYFAFHHQT